jgi:hypothetical protein
VNLQVGSPQDQGAHQPWFTLLVKVLNYFLSKKNLEPSGMVELFFS